MVEHVLMLMRKNRIRDKIKFVALRRRTVQDIFRDVDYDLHYLAYHNQYRRNDVGSLTGKCCRLDSRLVQPTLKYICSQHGHCSVVTRESTTVSVAALFHRLSTLTPLLTQLLR